MTRIARLAQRLMTDRRGATAVEYGLILALIFLAMVAGARAVGEVTVGMWDNVSTRVVNAGR